MKGFFCKITLALCFVIFVGSAARADEVTFSANAPMVVTAGESFRVEFSLNATPDDDSFEAPDFGAFDVLAGPAISQGHSIQIINGAMTKKRQLYDHLRIVGAGRGQHHDRSSLDQGR